MHNFFFLTFVFEKKQNVLLALFQDHILIELSQAGLKGSESESSEGEGVLVVNPNYVLEDWRFSFAYRA